MSGKKESLGLGKISNCVFLVDLHSPFLNGITPTYLQFIFIVELNVLIMVMTNAIYSPDFRR